MQIASKMGGLSLGEADLLRKAMGKKLASVMISMRDKFLAGIGIAPKLDRCSELLIERTRTSQTLSYSRLRIDFDLVLKRLWIELYFLRWDLPD